MASDHVLSALDSLHKELERIKPAIEHVEILQRITESVKGIPNKHVELLKQIKDSDLAHKDGLKSLFANELVAVTSENKKILQTTSQIQELVGSEMEALGRLKESLQAVHKKIENINFPERLDKLDANVSGIMAAVQAIQGRLDTVERNLSDRLKELSERQKEGVNELKLRLEATSKTQQLITYVTWALIVVAIVLIVIFK